MSGSADALREDLALVDAALEPFSAPIVNERSGLRWMQRTLQDRRAHILAKIDQAERATVSVRVRTAAGTPDVPAHLVAQLLDALQTAVHEAGGAVTWPDAVPDGRRRQALTLQVGAAAVVDDWWELALHRPAGPLDAQPLVADDERTVFDAAVDALLDTLDDAEDGALHALAVTHGLAIELRSTPTSGPSRSCALSPRR